MAAQYSKPTILILGIERSGSTWLLNILDSSPDTIALMEPFADYAGLFPGFPHRFHYIDEVNEIQSKWVQDQFRQLYKRKFPFLYKPGKALGLRRLDLSYVTAVKSLMGLLKIGKSRKIEQYELLNLTAVGFKKRSINHQMIIKELRLNYKVPFINTIFPDCKVLVAIRNPILQIDSIISKFKKGRLNELKRSLLFFESHLKVHPRFHQYQSLISGFSRNNVIEQLTIFWLITYNTLIEDLERSGVPYLIANNDALSLNPNHELQIILNFCQIEPDNMVTEYVRRSSMTSGSAENAIDTNRRSRDYFLKRMNNVDTSLRNTVSDLLRNNSMLVIERLKAIFDFS